MRPSRHRWRLALMLAVGATQAGPAAAQISATALSRALAKAGLPAPVAPFDASQLGYLIEAGPNYGGPGTRVSQGVYFVRQGSSEVSSLTKRAGVRNVVWAPPLRPLLDEVDGWVNASGFRQLTGLAGDGVMVGIVDTGFDIGHADLRDSDAGSRVEWLIDFSRDPAGRHPELEEQYGCTSRDLTCRILQRSDIDELLGNNVIGDEPRDRRGHGTHVASLAAGNGLSSPSPKYVGIAPQAKLVFAQVMGPRGSIEHAHVLAGTEFIFDRAEEASLPAVINVSLGTDFGAHDGTSLIERSLGGFVGDREGRAIVVAAGNSGAQVVGLSADYPEPFGVHSEVHVPAGSQVRVPVLTLGRDAQTVGSIFMWLKFRPGDDLRVAVGDDRGDSLRWVGSGESVSHSVTNASDDVVVTVVNSPTEPDRELGLAAGSAAVVISGAWQRGRTFVVHLEGEGSALMWVEGGGALSAGLGGGVFLPRSSKEGTVNMPAAHPALIAVGATYNRQEWPSQARSTAIEGTGTSAAGGLDSVAFFSSAGPNSEGLLKPDLVAPGGNVIGAMSAAAHPERSATSLFSGSRCVDPLCFVVDDTHAVSTGTSMAAPIVSGAVALLLQREPSLSGNQIQKLLIAGTRAVGGAAEAQQAGAGALDMLGSLRVQDLLAGDQSAGAPSALHSRLVFASSFVRPDPAWPLFGKVLLRDTDGDIADAALSDLDVEAPGAADVSLTREAPGLLGFKLSARADSGGASQPVRVLYKGDLLVERNIVVAVDRPVAHAGLSPRGGCQLARGAASDPALCSVLLLMLLGAGAARRRAAVGSYLHLSQAHQIDGAQMGLVRKHVGIERVIAVDAADVGSHR